MLSALRDLFSPKRRRIRRQLDGMFGTYVSPELVETMIAVESGAARRDVRSPAQRVRVIAFFYPGWGFSDASLPKLQAMLATLDAAADVSHRGMTICFTGQEAESEFKRVRGRLESALTEPEFRGFRLGVAEGDAADHAGVDRLTATAFRKATQPTPPV